MRRLLIVDDETSIRLALTEFFCTTGYQVDTADCRPEAEALVQRNQYDVVIADLRLSDEGEEGLDILSTVRARSPRSRVIILTAFGTPTVESLVEQRAGDRLLMKPVPLQELSAIVAGLCPTTH